MTRIAANSSPLITLAAAGYLQMLQHVVDEVLVPERVWHECVVQGSGRPGAEQIAQAGWVRVVPVADASYVQRLHLEIDLGESEAIALARQLAAPVLMDERRGRTVARREGISVIGTAGILLQLKTEGVLPAVRPVVEGLIASGWRISGALLQTLFAMAAETSS